MNNTNNTQKLFLKNFNFSKIQHLEEKKTYKKGIIYLIVFLSVFLNIKTFANIIPNRGSSSEFCKASTPKEGYYNKNFEDHRSNKTEFTKTNELLPIIKLGFEYTNTENLRLHHQIAISFQATNSFDYEKGYDAESFIDNETDIYWKFKDDHRKYVITGVQEISDDLEVPLEITMGYSGQVDLMVDKIQNISREIYIKDKLTGVSYNIKDGKINLTLDKGVCSNRFVLAFRESISNTLKLENNTLINETTIYADNQNKNIVISKNQEITIQKIELFNILGKKTSLWNITEQKNSYKLAIKNQIPIGLYIVKMYSNKGTLSKKVVIE
ncbi:T9SS type A sorting domain-containing protein [Polaribacter sp. 20A6]|uniref:T9SS type A sorting domain-containing protein n=1 Tax=Polaribacter sp. 20A6 TaxID=2687289 RepID=UPI0013FD8888|nr:T9SS type A sorting domain-containing protein [Polaribacter sp. 20A6]